MAKYTQSELYKQLGIQDKGSLDQFKHNLYQALIKYFSQHQDDRVLVDKQRYLRLHDGGIHTWSSDDWISDVLMRHQQFKYIQWV